MKQVNSERQVEQQFHRYSQSPETTHYHIVQYVCIIMLLFGLLCLAWALPFPQLRFMSRYNGYFNWASILLAVMVYYYLKLSPIVSYFILFLLFGCSYGIMQLQQLEQAGGISLFLTGLGVLVSSYIILNVIFFINSQRYKPGYYHLLLFYSPVWLVVKLLQRFNMKY